MIVTSNSLLFTPHSLRLKMKGGKKMAIDPVCKMEVNEETAKFKSEYKGKIYYFCAPGCKNAFEENPEKYLNEEEASEK